MSGSQQAPTVPAPAWQIVYNGADITEDISDTVIKVTYEEEVGKKANHIAVDIDDSLGKWQTRLVNTQAQGATISLSIGYAGAPLVPAGTFQFDEYALEGPPDKFTIRGIQAPIVKPIRTRNTVAYENVTLPQIANTVAARHGLTVVSDAVVPNVVYQRVTQNFEDDLAFLHRIANDHNYEVQVRNDQLIFYSRVALETAAIVGTIVKTALTRFKLLNQVLGNQTYKDCVVDYFDPATKALVSAGATDPTNQGSDTLKVIQRSENAQQAQLKAAGQLHRHNKKKCTSTLTLPGTMLYRAGQRVSVSGFGVFDLNDYLVQSGKHDLTRSGYETELRLETNVQQQGAGQVQDVTSDEET